MQTYIGMWGMIGFTFWSQIFDVLTDAGRACGVTSACLYGGTSKKPQISALESGVVRYSIFHLHKYTERMHRHAYTFFIFISTFFSLLIRILSQATMKCCPMSTSFFFILWLFKSF